MLKLPSNFIILMLKLPSNFIILMLKLPSNLTILMTKLPSNFIILIVEIFDVLVNYYYYPWLVYELSKISYIVIKVLYHFSYTIVSQLQKEKELFDPLFLNICRKKEVSALDSGILEVVGFHAWRQQRSVADV